LKVKTEHLNFSNKLQRERKSRLSTDAETELAELSLTQSEKKESHERIGGFTKMARQAQII